MSPNTSPTTELLSTATCWQLLRGSAYGRLAVVVQGAPEIFPINFVADHGSIVFRTAAGTKLLGARTQPVAFEVDGIDGADGTPWSVVVKGVARQVRELYDALEVLALDLVPFEEGLKPTFVRIEPTSVTGRRIHLPPAASSPAPPSPSS